MPQASTSNIPHASMVLSVAGSALDSTAFRDGPYGDAYRTSARRRANHVRIYMGDQVVSVVLFLMHLAHWVLSDPERADRELEEAFEVEPGIAVPASAPEWSEEHGSFVSTAAEALNRRCYNSLVYVFGNENLKLVKQAFLFSRRPASLLLNSKAFDPRGIEVRADGQRVTDPRVIAHLMEALAASRGWSVAKLLRRNVAV